MNHISSTLSPEENNMPSKQHVLIPSMVRWADILLMAVLGAVVCLLLDKWIVAGWMAFSAMAANCPLGFSRNSASFTGGFAGGLLLCAVAGIGGIPDQQRWKAFLQYPPAGLAGVLGVFIYSQAWIGPNLLLCLIALPVLLIIFGFWKNAFLFFAFCLSFGFFIAYSFTTNQWDAVYSFSGLGLACLGILVVRSIASSGSSECMKDEIQSKKNDLPRDNQKESGESENTFSEILKSKESFLEWLEEEKPIEKMGDDLLDARVYAERIAGQLQNERMNTVALVGPYGCGKTSILQMVEKKLKNCNSGDQETGNEKSQWTKIFDCLRNANKDSKFIFCWANEWGVVEGTGAENILKNVIREMSKEVDCLAISRLPAHYRRAMEGGGQTPLKVLSELLSAPREPCNLLEKINTILTAIGKKLIIFVEDVDRHPECEKFFAEVGALLDRLKPMENISFVITVGDRVPKSDLLIRVAEHKEYVPPGLEKDIFILLLKRFKKFCLEELKEQEKTKGHQLFHYYDVDGEWGTLKNLPNAMYHHMHETMYSDDFFNPGNGFEVLHAVAGNSIRAFKTSLRRTWSAWDRLCGEIDLDDLVVANFLRENDPVLFQDISERISSYVNGEAWGKQKNPKQARNAKESDKTGMNEMEIRLPSNQEKDHTIRANAAGNNTQGNSDAKNILIVFLFPAMGSSNAVPRPQGVGVRSEGSPDYWRRLVTEQRPDEKSSDQRIMKAMVAWEKGLDGKKSLVQEIVEGTILAEAVERFSFLFGGTRDEREAAADKKRELFKQYAEYIVNNRISLKGTTQKGICWNLYSVAEDIDRSNDQPVKIDEFRAFTQELIIRYTERYRELANCIEKYERQWALYPQGNENKEQSNGGKSRVEEGLASKGGPGNLLPGFEEQ